MPGHFCGSRPRRRCETVSAPGRRSLRVGPSRKAGSFRSWARSEHETQSRPDLSTTERLTRKFLRAAPPQPKDEWDSDDTEVVPPGMDIWRDDLRVVRFQNIVANVNDPDRQSRSEIGPTCFFETALMKTQRLGPYISAAIAAECENGTEPTPPGVEGRPPVFACGLRRGN